MSYRYRMPRKQLMEVIDSREFSLLCAEESIEPRGGRRLDLAAGVISSTVASAMGGKAYKPTDFMPDFNPDEVDAEELLRQDIEAVKAYTLLTGGMVDGKHREDGAGTFS